MRNYLAFESGIDDYNNISTIFCDDIVSIIETMNGFALITKQNLIFAIAETSDDDNCAFLIGAGGELVRTLCSFISRGYSEQLDTDIQNLLNEYAEENPDETVGDIHVSEQCIHFDMSHIIVKIYPISELGTIIDN